MVNMSGTQVEWES